MNHPRNCAIVATAAGLLTVGGLICIIKNLLACRRRKRLRKVIEEQHEKRATNFRKIQEILNSSKFDPQIVNLEFDVLRTNLQNDVLTPTEVLLAFQAQALRAQISTNCVVEFLLEANQWAEELIQKFQSEDADEDKPYLYGIPISVKECFKIKNHDQTMGLLKHVNQPADDDCAIIKQLKHLGAVPFVVTTVPQAAYSIGCSSPLFGVTTNLRNPRFTSGGSSGGEGPLIATRGSPLGLGGDIGGSVRAPAHFCGIYSLMPTNGRLSVQGVKGPISGLVAVKATAGAMGQSVDSLIAFYRSMWPQESNDTLYRFDPYVAPVPFSDALLYDQSKLVVGYYDDDGFLDAVPACKRAVGEAARILASMGHTLVKFQPPEITKAMCMHFSFLAPDNWRCFLRNFDDEIVDAGYKEVVDYVKSSLCKRWHMGTLKQLFRKPGPRCGFPDLCFFKNLSHHREMCAALGEYKENFIRAMQSAGVTCLLCPVTAGTVPKLDYATKLIFGGWNYCALYNLLEFPAGVVPCTVVTEEDEKALQSYQADDYISRVVKQGSEGAVGMPVGVQIAAMPYCDEMCLRLMKELEAASSVFVQPVPKDNVDSGSDIML